jgi:hypothetical protein
MLDLLKKYCCIIMLLGGGSSFAQTTNTDFKAVDEYVQSLGALDTLNMGTISNIVTRKFPSGKDKVRAIFDWIAFNISFDCKIFRSAGNEKMLSDNVLKTRKANAYGYAALFQDMCSVAKIRCLTVDGYVKRNTDGINEKPDAFNHTWAVVQLGQTTDPWEYVDPTWGSGFTDDKMTTFTRQYNDAYFFADKKIFNYQHFPGNNAWLFGQGIKSLKEFLALPLVKDAAFEYGVSSFLPGDGFIKTKNSVALRFSLKVGAGEAVEIVSLAIGEGKKRQTKTMDYTIQNGSIYFNYTFTEEDIYPVSVLVNNKSVLIYVIEVIE